MATLTSEMASAPREAQSARFARLRRQEQVRYLLLLVPAVVFLIAFYGYPVAAMLTRSFSEPTWGWQNFEPLVQARSTLDLLGVSLPMNAYIRVFGITLQVAVVVTVFTLLLGYPVAYALSSVSASRANLLMILVLIPFWTSILVRSYAWMVLLGQEGIINEALIAGGLRSEPMQLLNTRMAVYTGMIHILLPFMILPLYAVMRGIDRNLLRAAGNLGAAPSAVFTRIFLPLSLPGVAAGCLLVFILALGFYITPALLGGQRDVMISMLIQQQISPVELGIRRGPGAGAAGHGTRHLSPLHPSARRGAGLRIGPRMTAATPPTALSRASAAPIPRRARRARERISWGRVLLWVLVAIVLAYLVFPVFIVAPVSFSSAKYLQFPPPGWSLQWYENYFAATRLGAGDVAQHPRRADHRGAGHAARHRRLAGAGARAVPRPQRDQLVHGLAAGGAGHHRRHRRLLLLCPGAAGRQSARTGAGPHRAGAPLRGHQRLGDPARLRRAARVRRHESRRQPVADLSPGDLADHPAGVFAGALFAFIVSFDELIVALFVSGSGAVTLPRKMWDSLRQEIDPTIAAVSTILITLSIVILLVAELLRQRSERTRTATWVAEEDELGVRE